MPKLKLNSLENDNYEKENPKIIILKSENYQTGDFAQEENLKVIKLKEVKCEKDKFEH